MFRAIAVAVVVLLAGLPAAGVVCGMRCSPDVQAAADGCHDGSSHDSAPQVRNLHLCDHAVPIATFLPKATQFLSARMATAFLTVDAAPPVQPERIVQRLGIMPPGIDDRSTSVRTSVLRI